MEYVKFQNEAGFVRRLFIEDKGLKQIQDDLRMSLATFQVRIYFRGELF